MFRKSNFVLIFCILVQSTTGSAKGTHQNTSLKSVLGDKTPQLAEQTFNINNWGLGKIEQNLLTVINAKIDALSGKVTGLGSITGPACPEGWVVHGKSCYLIINIPTLKQSDARRACLNLGGDLAIIRSAAENAFIFNLMKKQKTVTAWGVWLGFIRKAGNKFYWIDGTPLAGQYSPWSSGEPNNAGGNEYCGNMFNSGKWNDLWCNLKESQLKNAPSVLCQKKSK